MQKSLIAIFRQNIVRDPKNSIKAEKFLDILRKICKNKEKRDVYIGENPLLLQFSVKNFRSFQKEEVLNLSAGKRSELRDSNTFEFSQSQCLVRSAVIYGPNAGGKSNLIRAIFFPSAVCSCFFNSIPRKAKIPLQPFRLNAKSQMNQVSFLLISFVMMFGSLIM